jgi:hypothetical protein
MTSLRQIEANRRNAKLSTGPLTEEGKRKSRRNALRHGLSAETVIDALEDAEDYAAFEMTVTADYNAQSAVERELVLRLASLLWRLRCATAIESGLFQIQARQLRQFRRQRRLHQNHQNIIDSIYRRCLPSEDDPHLDKIETASSDDISPTVEGAECSDDVTGSFVRLTNLSNFPLDRLSRYEATLWRQACQVLFTLRCLNQRKPWRSLRLR